MAQFSFFFFVLIPNLEDQIFFYQKSEHRPIQII